MRVRTFVLGDQVGADLRHYGEDLVFPGLRVGPRPQTGISHTTPAPGPRTAEALRTLWERFPKPVVDRRAHGPVPAPGR